MDNMNNRKRIDCCVIAFSKFVIYDLIALNDLGEGWLLSTLTYTMVISLGRKN